MNILIWSAVVGAEAVVIFIFDPARSGVFPPCVFHELTGCWCPGCGSTRALHQLLHGHVGAAFQFNPLAMSLLPVVGFLAVRSERFEIRSAAIWVLLGIVVMFGVLRNVPSYPFTLLAP